MQRLLIIGCGDVARRALPWLVKHYRVYAAVRSDARHRELRALGVTPLRADLDKPNTLRRLAGIGNLILHFAPPQETGLVDKRTKALLAALSTGKILPRRLVYISTSGVYGDCGGAWVSEERPLRPQTGRARRRGDAEALLRRFGRSRRVAVPILRAPGIYAGDRLPLARLEHGLPLLQEKDDIYTNHIHADDLAAIALSALTRGRAGRIYNASDDSALRMGDYFDLLADRFGLSRAPRLPRAEVEQRLSPAMLSFMGESRRLTNRRIKHELGVRLKYPDVATTLGGMLPEGT
ncbi:MAG: SDR family oxidoreductase [Rhodocyclales bacterium]|nr:SDR family oxidoreductase [Rhodocyclales bacterium]